MDSEWLDEMQIRNKTRCDWRVARGFDAIYSQSQGRYSKAAAGDFQRMAAGTSWDRQPRLFRPLVLQSWESDREKHTMNDSHDCTAADAAVGGQSPPPDCHPLSPENISPLQVSASPPCTGGGLSKFSERKPTELNRGHENPFFLVESTREL
jgi:hypothetical protein